MSADERGSESDSSSEEDEEEEDNEEQGGLHALQVLQQQAAQAAVLVENSREVYVGPRLNYNGPVTVNQVLHITQEILSPEELMRRAIAAPAGDADATRVNVRSCAVEANKAGVESLQQQQNVFSTPRKGPSLMVVVLWFLLALISIFSVCIAIAFAIQRPQVQEPDSAFVYTNSSEPDEPMPNRTILPGGHYIFSKLDWRGAEALSKRPLLHPIRIVIISHTETPKCLNFQDCCERMRSIQAYQMGRSGIKGTEYVDIGYNFVIGGDENVYEGRGWDVATFHAKSEETLGISFIGDYRERDFLTDGQIEAAQQLLALGVNMGKLSPSYVLIAHNQSFATDSPGKNIIKVIQKWPNWSPYLIIR
ncbi:peptidoglycan-recognition protein LA-like [Periplaneta americana]|uniref:peptidoglycan-recognition protein LA-like n=1 Tax=Periplaneta americana TaxID=6978 RepID=UPI0037E76873